MLMARWIPMPWSNGRREAAVFWQLHFPGLVVTVVIVGKVYNSVETSSIIF